MFQQFLDISILLLCPNELKVIKRNINDIINCFLFMVDIYLNFDLQKYKLIKVILGKNYSFWCK